MKIAQRTKKMECTEKNVTGIPEGEKRQDGAKPASKRRTAKKTLSKIMKRHAVTDSRTLSSNQDKLFSLHMTEYD